MWTAFRIISATLILILAVSGCSTTNASRTAEIAPDADVYLKQAQSFLDKNNPKIALMHFDQALKLDPERADIHAGRGEALLKLQMEPEARKSFEAAIVLSPRDWRAHYGLGIVHFREGAHAQAIDHFIQAVKGNPKLWQAYNLIGIIHESESRHSQALVNFMRAHEIEPNQVDVLNNMGISHAKLGEGKASIDCFEKVIAQGRGDSVVYNNLGMVLFRESRVDEAFNAFRKAGSEAQAYNNLGFAYFMSGYLEQAEECFRKAIDLSPVYYAKAYENINRISSRSRPVRLRLAVVTCGHYLIKHRFLVVAVRRPVPVGGRG